MLIPYSEEKAKLLRTIVGKVEEKDAELQWVLNISYVATLL